jgi:DNA-binding transcriptional LysR family regulator
MHGTDVLGWSSLLGSNTKQFAAGRDVFRCDDFEALRLAALSDFGIALLPSWVVGEDIMAGRLTRLLPRIVDESGNAGGIYALRALVEPPTKVSAFTASLQRTIGSPPIWDRVKRAVHNLKR